MAQTMIVGNDEKVGRDENGKSVQREPGHDTLSVVDISKPEAPVVAATIPLQNTITGPPVNLAIHPSGEFALVANSVNAEPDGEKWKNVPDNRVFVVDLKQNPPKIVGTVEAGKQPSGMAISPKGDLALVANRADGSLSVLAINGKDDVKVTDTVVGRRTGGPGQRGRDHAGRQARAGGQIQCQQDRAADDRRRQGDVRQARPAGRRLSVQSRRDAGRQAGADRR